MDDDEERKMQIIREVYYAETGFGSNAKALADAQEKRSKHYDARYR